MAGTVTVAVTVTTGVLDSVDVVTVTVGTLVAGGVGVVVGKRTGAGGVGVTVGNKEGALVAVMTIALDRVEVAIALTVGDSVMVAETVTVGVGDIAPVAESTEVTVTPPVVVSGSTGWSGERPKRACGAMGGGVSGSVERAVVGGAQFTSKMSARRSSARLLRTVRDNMQMSVAHGLR
jgi:hypothetical protein